MRVYNFSAGPACLPLPVLEKAQREFIEHEDHGMSVMEMSHRSGMFEEIINAATASLKRLMSIPEGYKVLYLQGGASSQFAMIPLNLGTKNRRADYVSTGMWSKRAIAEAKRYIDVNVVASSQDKTFNYIPELDPKTFDSSADYFHITSNNTIYGTKWPSPPDTGNVPLISDMSSNILSERIDVSKYAVIYAGAQKNIAAAGLTIVIIREDLIGAASDICPTMFDYKTHADNDSLYNTPPTYCIYIAKLVFDWLESMGGVTEMEKLNKAKASLLYDYLDESRLFSATVEKPFRSIMNVPFVTGNDETDAAFIKAASAKGLVNLKGHRSVGGMRASIYNPMPYDGVKALVDFMKQFESDNR
ncbi:MAG: 3-phosphoserine/phosphohydroxythreonine transaminase [Christensenellales bacterium]|jgi:phosphoserine aminotransferase